MAVGNVVVDTTGTVVEVALGNVVVTLTPPPGIDVVAPGMVVVVDEVVVVGFQFGSTRLKYGGGEP